jgi:hypothetical protein
MNEALVDFYRCPATFMDFTPGRELSRYFYDQPPFASSPTGSRNGCADLFHRVVIDKSTPRLPFDPCKIVDNLRRERYTARESAGSRANLSTEAIRNIYYYFRPLLTVSVRKHLQKLFLRNWQKLTFPTWPVDRTVEQINERLLFLSMEAQNLDRIPFIWFWPEGAPICVMVTHDIETKDGVSFVPNLMDIDDAFGIQASFQVIPEKQYPVSTDLLNGIRDRGFELNVQDLRHDGNLFSNREQFERQAPLINRYLKEYGARGFRAGRLYRNVDWLSSLDIDYDMSVPNVAHLESQRGGCCTVFPYFIDEILELPLTTIQDYSLLHILGEYSIELWKKQIALIIENSGLASFIVHPDYILDDRALMVYKSLLGYLVDLRNERGIWITRPQEVDRWWRERSLMKLVSEGGEWRITGKGKERSRLAYASRRDGQITYSLEPGCVKSRD